MNVGTQIKQSFDGWRLMGTPFVFGLLLLLTPILLMVLLSFWTQDYLDLDRTFTLANYKEVFSHPVFITLIKRSVVISLFVTAFTVILAFPVAYYISFYGGRRKALLLFLITIPFWTSYLLRVFSWRVILGNKGVINSALMGTGMIDEPLGFLLYNQAAVIITLSHAWAAFAILPLYVSLDKIDKSLLEASYDLGNTKFETFWRVTFPLSLPGVIGAILIIFIPTVGDYVTPQLVGGTDGRMLSNMIQSLFGRANNFPLGAASAVIMLTTVCLIAALVTYITKKVSMRMS